MRRLIVLVMVFGVVGCSGPKIKKAYDEGYASGRFDTQMNERDRTEPELKMCRERLSNCLEANSQLRARLDLCQSANREK